MKEFKDIDLYLLLETTQNATKDDIKKAYRKKAKELHPDKHSSASVDETKDLEAKFKEVREAYAVLSDKNKRRMYDCNLF